MTRRISGFVLVALMTLAACGGSHKTSSSTIATNTTLPPPSDNRAGWDPAAIATVKALVLKLQHKFPSGCVGPGLLPHAQYLGTMKRLGLTIPLAVVDCTGVGESIELSIFPDAGARSTYVSKRSTAICKAAVKGKYDLPGLHWVVGPDFAIEPESEGLSREFAPVVGGAYQLAPCPGHQTVDWDPAAEKTVDALGAKLTASPRIACTGFRLLNRDQYVKIQAYAHRLPAAYAGCVAVGNTQIYVAALSAVTVTPASFITSETRYQCTTAKGITAVRGPDWVLIVSQEKVAAVAAAIVGGTALPPAC